MPVQKARHSWATASPLYPAPQQATENHPCVSAPAAAAHWVWAGEHRHVQNKCTEVRETSQFCTI